MPPFSSRWGASALALKRVSVQNTTALTTNTLTVKCILNSETFKGEKKVPSKGRCRGVLGMEMDVRLQEEPE